MARGTQWAIFGRGQVAGVGKEDAVRDTGKRNDTRWAWGLCEGDHVSDTSGGNWVECHLVKGWGTM